METTESFSCQNIDGGNEMPALNVMINSPQFSRVLEQMGDFEGNIHSGMKKKAGAMWKSMPSIQVTCFDDEPYNEKMLNELENPPGKKAKETAIASEAPLIGNSTTQLNNDNGAVYSGNSRNDEEAYKSKATSSGEENSAMENSREGVLPRKNTPRKCSKGFVVSSQTPHKTKTENNSTDTKGQATSPDDVKSSEAKPARKPTPPDSRLNSDILSSPSVRRRRYTICSLSGVNESSNEPQNKSKENNDQKTSVGAIQNVPRSPKLGSRKLSSEILNSRKKPEKIDLSFKVDSPANGSQNKLFKKRSHTDEGQTRKQRQTTPAAATVKRSTSDLTSNGDFRMFHDDHRLGDGNQSPCVEKPTGEAFQTKESNKSLGISENSLSLLNDAGVVSIIDNRNPKSAPMSVSENQSLSIDPSVDVTQRLNLASPPRARRASSPRPPQGERPSHLGVNANLNHSKSETDLRKIVAEEEKQRRVSHPPRTRRGSDLKAGERKSSLGVSGKLSLSKSETDLRKLVAEEEKAEARRPSLSSPQRVRKLSSSKPLTSSEMHGSASGLVSPQVERKIYLAAAKQAPRLSIRAKARNDLQASSQNIIEQAEKELDKFNERLPHISMEEVMKSWQTDSRHWNVVSSLVNPNSEHTKTNMEAVKNCRYIRDGVLKKKKNSH
ncbi:hypothetical protein ACROYT_G007810 [Oculina patagonica]